MVQTCFLPSSTNTGVMPPSMHFFTHAAPDPACLAPHIESEIQPLMLLESAALAATAANERATTSIAMLRFTCDLHGISDPADPDHAPSGAPCTRPMQKR